MRPSAPNIGLRRFQRLKVTQPTSEVWLWVGNQLTADTA
jgi:hypothetical protein